MLVGNMIIRFSVIENRIEEFITESYSSTPKEQDVFYKEIMSHPYFSFELKKEIFKKALKRVHPEIHDKFPWNDLNEIQKSRNVFAHRGVVTESYEELGDLNKMFFAKKGTHLIEVYRDFDTCSEKVMQALDDIPGLSNNDMDSKYYKNGKLINTK